MKRTLIKIPIFNQSVLVIWDTNLKTIVNYLEDIYSVSLAIDSEFADGFSATLPNNLVVIGLSTTDSYTALHECGHAVFALREILGWNANEEEVFCYTLEWIYKKTITFLTSCV